MRYYGFDDIREYVQPYEKRAYMSDSTDHATNGYAKWFAERHDLVAGHQANSPDRKFCHTKIHCNKN